VTAWSLACLDWRERIKTGTSLIPKLPLNPKEVERAIRSFDSLRLPDVPSLPPLAEAGGPWFRDIVAALFGSYDPATGIRAIAEAFVLVPKKNSKTTYGSALMLTALIVNRRPRAEFLLIAPTIKIAALAYSQACGMIEADDYLRRRFKIQAHISQITDLASNATLQVKSFDPAIVTGTRAAGILLDELHVVSETIDADRVVGQLRGGLISQPEGFLVFITTQSERPPAGVFRAELMKARGIRDGIRTGRMLPVIYEFPEDVDWKNPSNWWMVTPNRGLSVRIERLVEDHDTARDTGEEELRRWASQHLNVEIGLRLMSDAWPGSAFWEGCAEPGLDLDAVLARSDTVTIGIDGGGLDDLLGLAVLGRDRDSGKWLLWAHAWCHQVVLEKRKDIGGALRDYAADGDLTIITRMGDDVEALADIVERVSDAGLLPGKSAIGVDPAGIGEIVEAISARGIDARPEAQMIIGVPQGWKLTGAIKTVERKLAGGDLAHGASRLMNWCVGNAKVEPRGNAISITKQASGKAKIDPLMALFDAGALMAMNPAAGRSVYEEIARRKAAERGAEAPQSGPKAVGKRREPDPDDERFWQELD
jgi:phage terminase large subunit-like protein